MTTTLTPSETCQQVANIIDSEPHRFDMDQWESECGTKACIAGHTAILHGDAAGQGDVSSLWMDRQAHRLGLTATAGDEMFRRSFMWLEHNTSDENVRYSKVLRQLGQELENRDKNQQHINRRELHRIAKEALA